MKILKCLTFCTFLATVAYGQGDPPWKLYYDSTQDQWGRDWAKTVAFLEKAEETARLDIGIYHPNYLTIYNDLGTAYWKAGARAKAETTLARCIALKREIFAPYHREVILSMGNLAAFYTDIGAIEKAKRLYKGVLAAGPQHVEGDLLVNAARPLIRIYHHEHYLDSALFWLDQIAGWKVIEPNTLADHQFQLERVKLYRTQDQYEQALAALNKILAALQGASDRAGQLLHLEALQERGVLALQTGAYADAEKFLLDAWERTGKTRVADDVLTDLANNIAQVYDRLNIDDKALQFYEASLARCVQSYGARSLPCVTLLNNIAGIRLKRDQIRDAVVAYEEVIASLERLLAPSNPLYITALNNLATAYRRNGDLPKADSLLVKASRLLDAYGMQSQDLAATVLNNMAVLKTAQGHYQEAANYYGRALTIKRTLYGPQSVLLTDLVGNLAVTYWALGKPDEAIPLFKKSMELARRQVSYVFPNLNANEQVQFYKKLKEDFERFNTIAIHWAKRDPQLLSQMLQNRTILKSLQFFTAQRRKRHVETEKDRTLLTMLEDIRERRGRLAYLYQRPLAEMADPQEIQALEQQIDSLEKVLSLKSADAMYSEGMRGQEVRWEQLVPKLKADEAIVEFVRFRKYDRQTAEANAQFGFTDSVSYAALVITHKTKDAPELVLIKEGNQMEGRYYNYYRNALRYSVRDEYSWRFFWEPIATSLRGKKRVYVSADGVYYKINVNTLLNPATDRFVVEETDVVYLLNPIQLLEENDDRRPENQSAVLIGDPLFDVDVEGPRNRDGGFHRFAALPATQEEIRSINELLRSKGWTTQLYMRGAATETNLKSVSSPGILHVASHGYFSDDVVALNPHVRDAFLFHSGVVLTGANENFSDNPVASYNDGIVTAFEVMNLDLWGTSLVVLSACETGLGKIENGEGVFGLQRSFMLAGAENVMISLWKVDDEATRDLMVRFYTYLASGRSMHEALRGAQLDQRALRPDPSQWGGFILVGHH